MKSLPVNSIRFRPVSCLVRCGLFSIAWCQNAGVHEFHLGNFWNALADCVPNDFNQYKTDDIHVENATKPDVMIERRSFLSMTMPAIMN